VSDATARIELRGRVVCGVRHLRVATCSFAQLDHLVSGEARPALAEDRPAAAQ